MVFGDVEAPLPLNEAGTDMGGATERARPCAPVPAGDLHARLRHHELRRSGDYVMTNTPGMLRAMARQMTALGVKPEIEAFDTGHLWFAKQLVERRADRRPRADPALHGRSVGRAGRSQHLHGDGQQRAVGLELCRPSPSAATQLRLCRGGGARRRQCPRRARGQSLAVDKGVLATNAQLVERAVGDRRRRWARA